MHELSIVASIVDSVQDALAPYPGATVTEVRLRVGALAAVIEDSLQFCYGIATQDTPLSGSRLTVSIVPVTTYCAACSREGTLDGMQNFCCPFCGEPEAEVRQGKELEIESIEIEDPEEVVQR